MALTQVVRLKLEGAGFSDLFTQYEAQWESLAEQARGLMAAAMPAGQSPTVVDIKKTLFPLVEISPELRSFLQNEKLTQKFWITDFTDYILHRVYQPTLDLP
jgi:hypothetical protein